MAKKKKPAKKNPAKKGPAKKPPAKQQSLRMEAKAAVEAVDDALRAIFRLAKKLTYAGYIEWTNNDDGTFIAIIGNRDATLALESDDSNHHSFRVSDSGREELPKLSECGDNGELAQFFEELEAQTKINELDDISAKPRLTQAKELLESLIPSQEEL